MKVDKAALLPKPRPKLPVDAKDPYGNPAGDPVHDPIETVKAIKTIGAIPGVERAYVGVRDYHDSLIIETRDQFASDLVGELVPNEVNGMKVKVEGRWVPEPRDPNDRSMPVITDRMFTGGPEYTDRHTFAAALRKLPGVKSVKLDDYPTSWHRYDGGWRPHKDIKPGQWYRRHDDSNDHYGIFNVQCRDKASATYLENLLMDSVRPKDDMKWQLNFYAGKLTPEPPPEP